MRTTALILGLFLGSCGPVAAQSAEEAIAMFLFGQPNPSNMFGPGIYGHNDAIGPIRISQIAPCKFRVSDPQDFEEIDFNSVAEIRHSIVPKMADQFKLILEGHSDEKINQKARKVVRVQVMGSKTAVCSKSECTAKRAFNFDDTDQIDRARRAALFFREHICKGKAF